jgi:hypothetical protein
MSSDDDDNNGDDKCAIVAFFLLYLNFVNSLQQILKILHFKLLILDWTLFLF